MSYPYSQDEHDDAVGVGCLLLLVVFSPLLVAGMALAASMLMGVLSAAMVLVQ